MPHWLAPRGAAQTIGTLKRFDARYWSVDFPRPMMACAVTTGTHSLRVEAVFYRTNDLAGLIWEAEDRHDHPLLAYETSRDFRRCRLSFRWRSGGIVPLDAANGPTLTIEGRDETGAPRSWYVRLWNYAEGAPEDAALSIDFGAIAGGWGGEEPVWAGDVDRMFVSLVPPGYSGADGALDAPAAGWAEMSEIACDGSGSVLAIGDGIVPEHDLRIATAYDDLYHLTPARLLRNAAWLGYRAVINHYVGMSHYFRLDADMKVASGGLNGPCAAWHCDFAERARALGYELILSISYELLAAHCPEAWMQRDADGAPALTGWAPPSALLSPANDEAMAYLREVMLAFAGVAAAAGQRVRMQIGEPWWWVTEGRISLYDAATVAALAPVPIADLRQPLDAGQKATLDAAGAALAASTAAHVAAVKQRHPGAETLLLTYLPTVLDPAMPEAKRANLPIGWAAPAFDVLQVEDYEWVTADRRGASATARAEAEDRLGYGASQQHYLAGFVATAGARADWPLIAGAAGEARRRGVAETFVWALPQVLRDGFVHFEGGEEVDPFDDVAFPLAIGREATVEPGFSTDVFTAAGGAEQRNSNWADALLRFDVGPGVRSEADLHVLIGFFRARRGAAIGFRFADPLDDSSNGMTGEPDACDQLLGIGDGVRTEFALIKSYGNQERRITRPVAATVRVAVAGIERASGWTLGGKGRVSFDQPPPTGAEIRAGFRFHVPVRFAEDRLAVGFATFRAGEVPSVPLVELREE